MAVRHIDAVPLARVGATLGEGPVWIDCDGAAALWFVDIKERRIHRLDPVSGQLDRWAAPDQPGWLLPTSDGGFLTGLASGLHRFCPDDGFTSYRPVEPDLPHNRLNDAAVAPDGALWFGTMDDEEASATGRLHRLRGGDLRDSGIEPIVITNGPAISPDGSTLYAVDTLGRTIDAYTIGADGHLTDKRRFLTIEAAHGHPDGAICDAEGGIWVAFFGGWAARRYTPDGQQTDEVRFPAANITKIAIGGPDGLTAFATSARKGLDATALAAQPHAGDIFTFRVTVPGLPAHEIDLMVRE